MCQLVLLCLLCGVPQQGSPATDGSASAIQLLEQGTDAIRAREFEKAVLLLTRSIKLRPESPNAYFARGTAFFYLKYSDAALVDLGRAISIDEAYPEAHSTRGMVLQARGQLDKAMADYDRAVEIAPNNQSYRLRRGLGRLAQQAWAQAIADFSEALRLQPDYAKAYICRGEARSETGDLAGARADLDQAIRLMAGPGDDILGFARRVRGDISLKQKDYRRAIDDYSEAIRLDPKDAEALRSRGDAYFLLGETARSIADLDRSIELADDDDRSHGCRGRARAAAGDHRGASEDYRRAAELKPLVATHHHGLGVEFGAMRLPGRRDRLAHPGPPARPDPVGRISRARQDPGLAIPVGPRPGGPGRGDPPQPEVRPGVLRSLDRPPGPGGQERADSDLRQASHLDPGIVGDSKK